MSIKLVLRRDVRTPHETCGWLSLGERKWPTIERPWEVDPEGGLGGRDGRSCVPSGEYRLEPHSGDIVGVWALVNHELGIYHWPWEVPAGKKPTSRVAILIHSANWAHELQGCIAPGKERKRDGRGYWYVTRSRDALNELRTLLGNRVDLSLVITGDTP